MQSEVSDRNKTIAYYNQNAASFIAGTVDVDFTKTQEEFLRFLPSGARLLDFGCGSGRDTKYFLEKGFRVEATDGSPEICRATQKFTGIPVRQLLFEELDEKEKYDGIWACASILHLPKDRLPEVFRRMRDALKMHGIIYTSFKYGLFEGERIGRYFTYLTEKSFEEVLAQAEGLEMQETWISRDARAGRENERWLNVILRKTS